MRGCFLPVSLSVSVSVPDNLRTLISAEFVALCRAR
jgi:hypothetical protein